MHSNHLHHTPRAKWRLSLPACLLMALLALCGCSGGMGVWDGLQECKRGVVMRFIFDYNLEFANAFPNQVDCLTVFIFDKDGRLVERRTETSGVLKDEDWRMTFDLPAGDYQAVAYGGLECDMATFSLTKSPEDVTVISDLEVLMHKAYAAGEDGTRPPRRLHDLFHGLHTFTVSEGTEYDRTTVSMMRDTNNIRVVLQHIDNSPVDSKDFRFTIVDDNTRLDYKNDILSAGAVTYLPWATGNASTGVDGTRADAPDVTVGYAEFSVSRLIHRSTFTWQGEEGRGQRGPRLRVTTTAGRVVADLPLNNYLLLLKGEYLQGMEPQEFLDRANNYSLIFFLDHDNAWVNMHIVVDDWTVRINNIDDFD